MSAPAVMAPFKISEELLQSTKAVHNETVTVTIGDNSAFTRRAFSAASTVALLTSLNSSCSRS